MFDWYYNFCTCGELFFIPLLMFIIDTMHSPIYQTSIGLNPILKLHLLFEACIKPKIKVT